MSDRDRHHHHRDHRGGDREWNRNGNGGGGRGHYQNRRDGGGGDYQQRDRGGDRGGGYRPQNDRHDGGYSRQNNYNNQQQRQNYDNRQNGQHRGGGGGYGGDQYRKRQQNDYNDGPPAKQAPIEEKPAEPIPIEIEVQGIIDGEKRRFHFKENAKFPDKVSAIHCLRIHGRIENSLPMNKKDVSMFLGQCGPLLGTGASLIMDEHKLNGLVMFKEDVVDKLSTICRSLFGNCEFLEFDEHRLNLLKFPFFTDQIHQLKVKIEGQSVLEANTEGMDALLDWLHGRNCSSKKKETNPKMLDFEAKGLAVARQFLQRIKFDPTVAQFVVRISCPTGQLSEFETIQPEQNIQMKMAKEGNAYILRKSLIESTSADQKQPVMRKCEEYPEKLPKICIPNVPKEKMVPTK